MSFDLLKGETLGLVGESGCGKTTVGKAIMRLVATTSGSIMFQSRTKGTVDLATLGRREMRPIRAEIQMIYQDPYSSLNPRWTVGDIVSEPLRVHEPELTDAQRQDKVAWLMEKVGLTGEQAFRYPHEFSGGQRQRIGIARALVLGPRLVIADEPVSALDVSIQAQILNLLSDLKRDLGLTYLFIAHDLAVVEYMSDRVAVMYLGKIVEIATRDDLYRDPKHPYTRALLSAIPVASPDAEAERDLALLEGKVPSPMNPPPGCPFHPRCPVVTDDCKTRVPVLSEKGNDHHVACLLHD